LYNHDGRKMPASFQKNKRGAPESQLWYSVQPVEGCGKTELRFCNVDRTVNWDLIHLHKKLGLASSTSYNYNCREYQLIDLYDEGKEHDSQIEQLCHEQVQGCANRLYRGCDGNGHVSQDLVDNDKEECLMFDEMDSNLVGQKSDQGVDLVWIVASMMIATIITR